MFFSKTFSQSLAQQLQILGFNETPELLSQWFGLSLVFFVGAVVVGLLFWKKLGLPTWSYFVPVYNVFVMLKFCQINRWNIVYLFLPFMNLYLYCLMCVRLSLKFRMPFSYALGMIFCPFVFFPALLTASLSDPSKAKI